MRVQSRFPGLSRHIRAIRSMRLSVLTLAMKAFPLARVAWTKCNDLLLNIRTEGSKEQIPRPSDKTHPGWGWLGPVVEGCKYNDNYMYASLDYWYMRTVVRNLELGPHDVVYDLGAGKGRFVCLAACRKVRKCVGIELIKPLCEIAIRNASRLRGKQSEIQILCEDASVADLSDGTVYCMFNPFGPDTLRDTLENIRVSLSMKPRSIRVLYFNPAHRPVLESCGWLECYREVTTHQGFEITYWCNLSVAL